MKRIGIIGGSGLEKLNVFRDAEEVFVGTDYGEPSSTFFKGITGNTEVFIISRHGRDHSIPPTQVNNRANIQAFRHLGVTAILATTACGSLREEIKRGDLVIPDQFIDFTKHRVNTFYDSFANGILGHSAMPDPFDPKLREMMIMAARQLRLPCHPKGTIITIEGPRFSTRAESRMFRSFGADVINMSIAPEVALANEAKIPYAAVAISTDYDSWKEDEEPVTWEEVLKVFEENVENVTELLMKVISG